MTTSSQFLKTTFILAALLLLAPVARAESAAQRAAKAGELSTIKNHRVLHLYGADVKERGFAHGYLLAEVMRDDLDAVLKSLPNFDNAKYETTLLPWATRQFDWDEEIARELDGIYEGMLAQLGREKLVSATLRRALKREDLNAMNTIADYFGPACSAFSSCDKSGAVLHARTLDFPIGGKAISDQIIVVSDASPGKKGWVCVGWPGLVAQYSGMNEDGLVVCLHDAYNFKRGASAGGFIARGVLLRRMLEKIDPASSDAATQAARLSSAKPSACGNIFHLSWPRAAADKTSVTPSALLEFDPSDRTTDIVRMDSTGLLVLTNHFRKRNPPTVCDRFKSINGGVDMLTKSGQAIGLTQARKLLMAAEQPVAAHSIYFFPDTRIMHVALSRGNIMSPRVAPTEFSLIELLKK